MNVPLLMTMVTLTVVDIGSWAEVYTSSAQMERVLAIEQQVVAILDDYRRHAEFKLNLIKNYVSEYRRVWSETEGEENDDPLRSYQLLRRLTVDWTALESQLSHFSWDSALRMIVEKRSSATWPREGDLQGAALALIRLKHTYRLNATDLSRGLLRGKDSGAQLSARDCLYLGRNSLHLQLGSEADSVAQAIEWLETAMAVAQSEGNATAAPEEIRPFLEEAVNMQEEQSAWASGSLRDVQRVLAGVRPPSTPSHEVRQFDALCRGERMRSAADESRLRCYLRHHGHPYLRLNPLKVEEQHVQPPLLIFHDVIYPQEIELIKTLARPQLQRSTVVGGDGGWHQVSDTRTSQNTWIYDDVVQQQPALQRLRRRMAIMSGLNMDGAEALQVANYGLAGHYVPHYDALFHYKSPLQLSSVDTDDLALGDRIATLMFYLSNVRAGGATAFPKMGAVVWPRKGSAVFWFNLKRNGKGDPMTLHGACPVLQGSKWVANEWIRERAQFNHRKCSLDSNE